MFGADKGTADRLDGKKLHIGIVQARFNESITNALAAACLAELAALGVPEKTSTMCWCPARWKCRWRCRPWPRRTSYDALIALGCIIRGETYHFELVANESGAGVTRVALDYQLPVANAILTTENLEQAIARQTDKGRDAARVAVEMANLLDDIVMSDTPRPSRQASAAQTEPRNPAPA
jgi:6,7-dimethyl-8-ribityllumazine synthase